MTPDRAGNRVLIPVGVGLPERPPSDIVWSLSGASMGTTWTARVIAPPGADKAGFIANALLFGYLNHAVSMYENRYASREDIEAAVKEAGYSLA